MPGEVVTVNGIPKSGTHALVRAVELLGGEAKHTHTPFGRPVTYPHLYIVRNPRNMLVSWLRHMQREITEATLIDAIRHFDGEPSLRDTLVEFSEWLDDTRTLTVKYERLLGNIGELHRICSYLNRPYVPGVFEALPFEWTKTKNLRPSDWREHWSPAVELVWRAEGSDWQWRNS